jgi:hypothetical protein
MVRWPFILGALPLLVFAIVPGKSKTPPPIVAKPVTTEGIRVIRMDDATFGRRWQPVYDMPPMKEIHRIAREGAAVDAVPEPTSIPRAPSARHRLHTKRARLDLCGRHNMRKVVTRGGKSWRCRR